MKDSVLTAAPKKRKPIRRKRRLRTPTQPQALRFSPYAWAKLLFLRDLGETEVGGFGLSAEDDLLLVEDVRLIGQQTTIVSVEFDDEAVADFFDEQVDCGLPPERFFRLWLHTHPGDSAAPSSTDEETFERVFGRCDWAVMAILAAEGQTYARLRFSAGPGGQIEIPVEIDYARSFSAADPDGWQREYKRCVHALEAWHESQLFDENGHGWPELDANDILEFLQDGSIDDDEFRSLFAAERPGAARETERPDGNGDRRGSDRPSGRHPVGGTRCAASATD
jgi:proteasome lid subunit RPN8/RPN11